MLFVIVSCCRPAAFAQATPDQTDPNAQQQPQPPATPGEPNATPAEDRRDRRHRHSPEPSGFDRDQAQRHASIGRGGLRRRNRQAARRLDRANRSLAFRASPPSASRGRAEIISIRGFSPDFTTVLLNGRQQASSGFNRAVEFDQYPSELLGSVVVYKTPDASIVGMGLAGTVDLRTIRPLEYGKRAIALNLRGQLDEGGGRNADFSK